MCCAFNMKAADEIFSGQTYPDLVMNLQSFDKNNRSNMFRVAGALNGKEQLVTVYRTNPIEYSFLIIYSEGASCRLDLCYAKH